MNQGHNSVANLLKTTIYNTDVDLVNDNMYTKFGLILSIRSQDIRLDCTHTMLSPGSVSQILKHLNCFACPCYL